MKTRIETLIFFFMLVSMPVLGQDQAKYRRSSLHMVLVESGSYPNKEAVIGAYKSYPFPDKYNKHLVGSEFLQRDITEADFKSLGFFKDTLKNPLAITKALGQLKNLKMIGPDQKLGVVLPSSIDSMRSKVELTIKKDHLANQLVAKWFNLDTKGNYNTDLIMQRGKYSASEQDKELANKMATSSDYLYDEELIGNTFTVFSKFKFYPNEPVARLAKVAALAELEKRKASGAPAFVTDKAAQGIEEAYQRTKEGYTLITTTLLYKLSWDKKTADLFKQKFTGEQDPAKRRSFLDTTSLITLSYLGEQTSTTLVTFKIGEKRTEKEVIDLTVKRSIDKVFTQLQKEYQVFRPVSPINTINPLTARIGLKEGLEAGQKFEILESRKDKKTGFYTWASIGTVKVDDKLPIWDNRIGAEEEGGNKDAQGNPMPQFTTFKGSNDAQAGMHVIRLK